MRIGTWVFQAAGMLLAGAALIQAQPSPSPMEREFLAWARANLVALPSVASDVPLKPLEPLLAMIGNAEVVSFGEGLHGAAEPLEFRNLLFRLLVERAGFTGIAIESGFVEGLNVNDYVLGITKDRDAAIRGGFTNTFERLPQQVPLVRWMREFNSDPKNLHKLQFWGLDTSANTRDTQAPLKEALRYLDVADPGAAARLRERVGPLLSNLIFDRFSDGPDHYPHLTQAQRDTVTAAIADLIALLEIHEAEYLKATSERAYRRALKTAIGARQVDEYVRQVPIGWTPAAGMADVGRMTSAAADRIKIDNAVWARTELSGAGKLMVFAHRDHIATTPVSVHLPQPNPMRLPPVLEIPPMMGMYLERRYQSKLITIGNLLAEDQSSCRGTRPPAAPGTLEALLSSLETPFFLLDLRTAPPKVAEWLRRPRELYGLSFPDELDVGRGFDIILFLKTVRPSVPCK